MEYLDYCIAQSKKEAAMADSVPADAPAPKPVETPVFGSRRRRATMPPLVSSQPAIPLSEVTMLSLGRTLGPSTVATKMRSFTAYSTVTRSL
jgi:hypothetical protein